jgi:hypothetical protein
VGPLSAVGEKAFLTRQTSWGARISSAIVFSARRVASRVRGFMPARIAADGQGRAPALPRACVVGTGGHIRTLADPAPRVREAIRSIATGLAGTPAVRRWAWAPLALKKRDICSEVGVRHGLRLHRGVVGLPVVTISGRKRHRILEGRMLALWRSDPAVRRSRFE